MFKVDNMKETRLNRYVYDFSVDYSTVGVSDIMDIHQYLMKKNKCMARLTAINESKTVIKVIKHISCNCKCEFDGTKCNLNQKLNKDKCRCECRNPMRIVYTEEIIFGIAVHAFVRMINI